MMRFSQGKKSPSFADLMPRNFPFQTRDEACSAKATGSDRYITIFTKTKQIILIE